MIHLFLSTLLWVWNHRSFDQISRNNVARREAETAYRAGKYERAVERYTYLTNPGATPDPALLLNLGHSCFRLSQYDRARPYYEKLRLIGSPALSAIADVQLGIIACAGKDSAAALTLFRQALLQDPDNEPARYNFELIKKIYSGRSSAAPSGQKPTPKITSGRQSLASGPLRLAPAPSLVRSAQKNDRLNPFRNLNMTEAQARQILDAMQSDDLPYSLARHRNKPKANEPDNQW